MRILDIVNNLSEAAFDLSAVPVDVLKAVVDPNATMKPRVLYSAADAQAELDRRAGKTPSAPQEVPGTLKAGDGSVVTSGDGTPVQAGTQKVTPPAPAPAAEPAPAAVATPVADPAAVQAQPVPPASDPTADNSGAPPAATTNFDSMSFGTAFKTARNQGLKQFTWKGKPYSTQLAGETPKATTPQSNQKAAPVQPGSSQKVAPDLSALQSGVGAIPADANKAEPYWVNGTRYEWKTNRGGGGWQATAQPGDKLQWNSTRNRSSSNFTGPDSQYGKQPTAESTGFTDENLERIVSLVHYR